jgi:hypothetical protein
MQTDQWNLSFIPPRRDRLELRSSLGGRENRRTGGMKTDQWNSPAPVRAGRTVKLKSPLRGWLNTEEDPMDQRACAGARIGMSRKMPQSPHSGRVRL